VSEEKYLSVTALTKYIKYKFDHDDHLKHVLLKGEVSNFKRHSRGHFYLTLKDDHAQISAIMFAGNARKVKFTPEDGMSILVEGYISVFEASGQYQIYINKMSEDGLGNLHVAFEQLKKKLSSEGLFEEAHKKTIPRFPNAIGVLTSPTGAAVRDIIHIVNRRFPLTKIIVYPTLVQGEYAKDDVVNNIELANKQKLVDVLIVGRGGGSIEDLWAFNEEVVARAIYASDLPIISSVGHETDFTISDFVADLRAPTPSGAAELAVPSQGDLLQYIGRLKAAATNSVSRLKTEKERALSRQLSSYVFTNPKRLIEGKSQRFDYLLDKLQLLSPKKRLDQSKIDLEKTQKAMQEYYIRLLKTKEYRYQVLLKELAGASPLNIMQKGYSMVKKEKKIIKSVEDLMVGDTLDVVMKDGHVEAIVKAKRKDE